jgi:hypothetical protein
MQRIAPSNAPAAVADNMPAAADNIPAAAADNIPAAAADNIPAAAAPAGFAEGSPFSRAAERNQLRLREQLPSDRMPEPSFFFSSVPVREILAGTIANVFHLQFIVKYKITKMQNIISI